MKAWTFEESLTVVTLKRDGHDDVLEALKRFFFESGILNLDVDELRKIEERFSVSGREIEVQVLNAAEEGTWRELWEKRDDYTDRDIIVIIEGDDTAPLLKLLGTVPQNDNVLRIMGATINPEIAGVRGYLILY